MSDLILYVAIHINRNKWRSLTLNERSYTSQLSGLRLMTTCIQTSYNQLRNMHCPNGLHRGTERQLHRKRISRIPTIFWECVESRRMHYLWLWQGLCLNILFCLNPLQHTGSIHSHWSGPAKAGDLSSLRPPSEHHLCTIRSWSIVVTCVEYTPGTVDRCSWFQMRLQLVDSPRDQMSYQSSSQYLEW